MRLWRLPPSKVSVEERDDSVMKEKFEDENEDLE